MTLPPDSMAPWIAHGGVAVNRRGFIGLVLQSMVVSSGFPVLQEFGL